MLGERVLGMRLFCVVICSADMKIFKEKKAKKEAEEEDNRPQLVKVFTKYVW